MVTEKKAKAEAPTKKAAEKKTAEKIAREDRQKRRPAQGQRGKNSESKKGGAKGRRQAEEGRQKEIIMDDSDCRFEKTGPSFFAGRLCVDGLERSRAYFQDLEQRPLETREALEQWLLEMSELEAVVSEDACWRQIKMTCDTENKSLEESFNYFFMEIQPKIQPYADRLNRRLVENPHMRELDQKEYFTYLRATRKRIELFREANIPLYAEASVLAQQFGVISGKMTVEVDGREYTLQQASKFLESPDRALRKASTEGSRTGDAGQGGAG